MKIIVRLLLLIATVSIAALVWWQLTPDGLPSDIISTNGRLEANQVEIASKTAGRIKNVLVQEGQMVQAGDLLVVMDNQQLLAQKLEAEAMVNQAELAAEEANAGIALRQIQLTLATSELARTKTMYEKHVIAQDKFEQDPKNGVYDMEAYALAKVCKIYGYDFWAYKFISDDGNPDDWEEHHHLGVEKFLKKLAEYLENS